MKNVVFEFHSIFAQKLTAFVEEKQALGYSYVSSVRILRDFDNTMLANQVDSDCLTDKVAALWIKVAPPVNRQFENYS